jgi:hypothetical protein
MTTVKNGGGGIEKINMEWLNDSTIRAVIISLGAVLARIATLPIRMTWKTMVRKLTVALFIGLCANTIITDLHVDEKWRTTIIALLALFADDILAVLLDLGNQFRKNPKGTFRDVFGWFKRR